MCGIAGVYLRDPEAKGDLDAMLTTLLDCIEHRGEDATGFVAVGNEGVVEWQKAACGATEFNRYRRPVPKGTRTILAHTRWATLGLPAFVENNHPLRRGSFFVIHNGHVSNHHKLFELANRQPYGQVDSEGIAARFASLGKLSAAPKVMSEIEGAAAIAAVDERKPGDLLLAKGYSSPLFVLQTKRYVLWGSTKWTVEKAYRDHIGSLPKRAKIVELKPGTALHFVNGKVKSLKFKPYQAPKVKPGKALIWKETSTEGSVTYQTTYSQSYDWEETVCDICDQQYPWNQLRYETDDEGFTLGVCARCDLETQALEIIDGDVVTDDQEEVNESILRQRWQ